jgi:ABC-type transport system involved in cytochrome c biogenesis permease subunit
MNNVLRVISVILFLLPSLALATSYGEPLPSAEASSLASHMLLNVAIGFYVLAFAFSFAVFFAAKNKSVILGRLITLIPIFLHASGYLLRWKELYDYGWGRFPLSDFYEALILYCLMLAVLSLFLQLKSQRDIVSSFFLPIVIAILLWANTTQSAGISAFYGQYSDNIELIIFNQRLRALNLLLLTAGFCLLTTAGIASLLRVATNMSARKPNANVLFPSVEALYNWNKQAMLTGTALFILGFVIGLFWENRAWGVYWSWEPHDILLAFIIIIYAFFSFRNALQGWHSSKATNRSIIGVSIVVITYFVFRHLFRFF